MAENENKQMNSDNMYKYLHIHISNGGIMYLNDIKDLISTLNDALDEFCEINNINKTNVSEVASISTGSLIIDILIGGIVVPIVAELTRFLIDKLKGKYQIEIEEKNKLNWLYEDNYKKILMIIDEYVVKKKNTDMKRFISKIKLSKNYTYESKRRKIQNIKTLLEKYNIKNTLDYAPAKNYGEKKCLRAFRDVCVDKGLKEYKDFV